MVTATSRWTLSDVHEPLADRYNVCLSSLGRLLVRRSGGGMGPEAPPAAAVTWQPAWLVHSERGDAGGGVAELGARLPLPAYGLALGDAVGSAATLEDLAAAYAQVIHLTQAILEATKTLCLGPCVTTHIGVAGAA